MSPRTKIVWLCVAGLGVVFLSVVLAYTYADLAADCTLAYPLACGDQRLGPDGFIFIIANRGEEPLSITEITVSRSARARCNYARERIGGDAVAPHRAITYFISADHPDGLCLMQDMIPQKTYTFDIVVEYVHNATPATVHGTGRVLFSNATVFIS